MWSTLQQQGIHRTASRQKTVRTYYSPQFPPLLPIAAAEQSVTYICQRPHRPIIRHLQYYPMFGKPWTTSPLLPIAAAEQSMTNICQRPHRPTIRHLQYCPMFGRPWTTFPPHVQCLVNTETKIFSNKRKCTGYIRGWLVPC